MVKLYLNSSPLALSRSVFLLEDCSVWLDEIKGLITAVSRETPAE